MSTISVYFDESGYTGENLLKEDQPTFSYATVTMQHQARVLLNSSWGTKRFLDLPTGELLPRIC